MRRKSPVELHVNHERWLVSYSDFVTLLFAFFVVMYSVSQVNEGKYRVLSSTLLEAFSVPQSAINPIQVGTPTLAVSPSAIEIDEPQESRESSQGAFENNADLPELSQDFEEQFADLVQDDLLHVNSNELWLEVELKDSILFPTASASPSLQAKAIFEEIAQMLSSYDNPVQVEGFTDDVPINNRQFSSNWELSAARSASVVKILAHNGVAPQRLSAVGYGEFQPVASNDTPEGRAQNRRVVLMISREKTKRPKISDEAEIKEAIASPEPEQSQPHPQPGLAQPSAPTDNNLEPEQQMEELLNRGDTAPTDANDAATDASDQTGDSQEETEEVTPTIEPVKLKDGGLLFTSDPDLPRGTEQ